MKSPSLVFPSSVSTSPPTTCLIPFPLAATDVFQCKLDQMSPSLTPLPDVYLNLACGAFIPEPVLAFWIWSDKACHAVSPQQISLLCQELSSPLFPSTFGPWLWPQADIPDSPLCSTVCFPFALTPTSVMFLFPSRLNFRVVGQGPFCLQPWSLRLSGLRLTRLAEQERSWCQVAQASVF